MQAVAGVLAPHGRQQESGQGGQRVRDVGGAVRVGDGAAVVLGEVRGRVGDVHDGVQRAGPKTDAAEPAADEGRYPDLPRAGQTDPAGDLEEGLVAGFGDVAAAPQGPVEGVDAGSHPLYVRGDGAQEPERPVVRIAERSHREVFEA